MNPDKQGINAKTKSLKCPENFCLFILRLFRFCVNSTYVVPKKEPLVDPRHPVQSSYMCIDVPISCGGHYWGNITKTIHY